MNLTSNFVAGRKLFNGRRVLTILLVLAGAAIGAPSVFASEGGEAALKLPDLSQVTFFGIDGHKLLLVGLVFCFLGGSSAIQFQPRPRETLPIDAEASLIVAYTSPTTAAGNA